MNTFLSFPACNRRGGVERIMVECANFLAARNHNVAVISASFDEATLDPAVGRHLVPIRTTNQIIRSAAFRRRAAQFLKGVSNQSPHVHASFGVVCPPDGVLWVQAVHAEWLKLSQARRGWKGRFKQRLNPFHPFILHLEHRYFRGRQYRKLIALTPRIRDELIEHYDVPASDICILPNGYNPSEFTPARRASEERERVRAELGYAPTDRVIVFVANELERKGFFPLVEALARLREPEVKLLVAGRVSVERHKELLARLGLSGRVKCVGPSSDVGRYYAAADLFALPTYYEAWGLVIVEALASGLPVLTSRLAGAAVAVREGQTGLLLDDPIDPGEIASKLDRLLRMAALPPEHVASTVEEYRWDKVLLRYEAILQEHCR